MTDIQFKDEYKSGNAEIDRQHKELINLMNEIIANPKLEATSESLDELLFKLINKVNEHFEYEEMLLEKYNYQDREMHKQGHLKYLEDLTELSMKLVNQDADTSSAILESMAKCFESHFLHEDFDFFKDISKENVN